MQGKSRPDCFLWLIGTLNGGGSLHRDVPKVQVELQRALHFGVVGTVVPPTQLWKIRLEVGPATLLPTLGPFP
jgi:hypothetical protein